MCFLLTACGQAQLEDLFTEYDEFPYITDSLFIVSLNAEDHEALTGEHLKILYEEVKKPNGLQNKNMIRALIEKDSIEEQDPGSDKIKDRYWQFLYHEMFALHKLHIASGIELYTWYLSFSDGNQGPELIMCTTFKNEKHY
jgi:hypothetical protein